ncbi:ABC-2 type transporter-domain-containing protein [Obelidium mucronatum]|nr:ABC-2 type transporter-domain-containing protein [Obelidium mucronatum]
MESYMEAIMEETLDLDIREALSPADSTQSQPDMLAIFEEMKLDAQKNSRYDAEDAKSHKTIADMLQDPRADPKSADFDHAFFSKAVRQYVNGKGMEFSQMPIAFRNLNIVGNALQDAKIHTVGSAITNLFQPAYQVINYIKKTSNSLFPPKYIEKDIIHDVSGVLKPGECVLVIGRPGSGCSSLLRAFSNHVRSFKAVRGEIKYSGFSSKELHDKFRGEIVYAEEGDPHYPSLTVRQTLEFALNCKVMSPEIRAKIIEVTLKLYGLVNCQNTVVGDSLLRGVSGGEKKRVSLAEATVIGGSAGIFDGCTKGLDAASSLDFVKGLRAFADYQNRTVVASCYQASDAMFELFDKVIVLADGQCTYFGPTKDAITYFQSLGFTKHPRDTAAEFLTTCASCNRISPRDLYEKYKASQFGIANDAEANQYLSDDFTDKARSEFIERLVARKQFHGSKGKQLNSLYSVPISRQARMLIRREIQIIRGNSAAIILSTFFNLIMAVIVGSVFYQLPATSAGAFTRGGAIYFGLLFNAVSAFAEIPKVIDGRTILYKHTDMALYRPSTHFLAQSLFEFLVASVRILGFSLILYYMVGLQPGGGHFGIFYLSIILTQQAFGYMLKVFGYLAAEKHQAINNAAVVLILCTMYAGYMIPIQDMKPWFKWILYINPLGYGFQTLMINEFEGLALQCVGASVVPIGPWYKDPQYQTCTLPGSLPGSLITNGLSYLSSSLDIDPTWKWTNLGINLAMMVAFIIIDCVVLETIQHDKAGLSFKFFKPVSKGKAKQDQFRQDEAAATHDSIQIQGSKEDLDSLNTLTWSNINYIVPHPKEKGKTLQLLNGVSGYARPGTMTALMGSSGAGKTTLLDVVARRKTIGRIEGDIFVGPSSPGKEYLKISGYCEQMDVHNKEATVREALEFAAFLRQPASVSKQDKKDYVQKIITLLEMDSLANALIGDLESGVGLSMEERKRLTIGVELVARPKIVFLDEPTSGLDAQAATNIIHLLKNLTKQGYALVVTIHQPSAMLFSEFDRLLLLGRGGKTIYFGELGNDCQTLLQYFEKTGAHKCDDKGNPAEYILDCIGAGTGHTTNAIDWFSAWKSSPEYAREIQILAGLKQRAINFASHHTSDLEKAKHRLNSDIPSTGYTIRMVVNRMFRSFWRDPSYNVGRVTFQMVIALVIGLTFFQCPATPAGAQNRIFALFQTGTLGVVVIKLVIPTFLDQRAYAIREQSQGAYGTSAFSLAITTAEIPFAIAASTAFFLLFYWTVGLNATTDNVGYFYALLTAFTLWSVSFGQMLASAIPNYGVAAAIIPILTSILSLFCGVTISYNDMPQFYKTWLYWIDPYHYLIEGFMVNDLGGLALNCDETSFVPVAIPANVTCGKYFQPYLTIVGAPGTLVDASAKGNCLYCPIQKGDDIFHHLGWSYTNRWKNFGYLMAFWLFNRVMTAIFIRRFKVKR